MTNGIICEGELKLQEYYLYKDDALHQPVRSYPIEIGVYFGVINYNNGALGTTYPDVPISGIPANLESTVSYRHDPIEVTYHGIYAIFNGIGGGYHEAYYGGRVTIKIPWGVAPPTLPNLQIGNSFYGWVWFHSYNSKYQLYQQKMYSQIDNPKPCYADLVGGYRHDSRVLPPHFPKILPVKTEDITIGYYKNNHAEPMPDLVSIDWVEYEFKLKKNIPIHINLEGCVLGTLYTVKGSNQLLDLLSALPIPSSSYSYLDYLPDAIPNLFSTWDTFVASPIVVIPSDFNVVTTTTYTETARELSQLGATNDYWGNGSNAVGNVNADRFLADDETAYRWHIEQQADNKGIGTLIMDSPRTIEIHKALDAAKFALNTLEPTEPRVTNLGHLIEKVAYLMGYRPNEKGEYIISQEKERTRRSVKDSERVDEKEYGGNYFASEGMLINRLPNSFDRKGEVVSGGVSMVHDLPQLIAEIQDQLNIALGLQESGAIAIKDGDRTYRYPNQLALLTDVVLSVASIHQLTHQTYISSLVTQQQTGEIIGGFGLPTVNRSTNIAINNKLQQIPYWGIAPQHSLARKIDTVAYNVGIVTGQVV